MPPRIRYLEPVRKQLAALDLDYIHEHTDLSVLRRVVRKRVRGLSEKVARTELQADAAELDKWLSTAGLPDKGLYFVLPILPNAVEVLLTEHPQERVRDTRKEMKESGDYK